jgi:hypothetical protein
MAFLSFKIVQFYKCNFIHANQKGAEFPDLTSTKLRQGEEQYNVDISYIKFHTTWVINVESWFSRDSD